MELKQTQYPDCHLCYALLKLCDGPKKKLAAALVKQLYFSVSFLENWKKKVLFQVHFLTHLRS